MIIAEKIGMTRIFDKNDNSIPVTIVKAGPCPVISIDNNRVKIGFQKNKDKNKNSKNPSKNIKHRYIREFKIDEKNIKDYTDKKQITVEDFKIGQNVDICGTSKGKGFAGVMKRHGFHGMPASHGHEKQRIPGSIGCRFPQRVTKGKRMAGHMGNTQITVKNVKIVDINPENNIIALRGATPGYAKKILYIKSK